MRYGRSDERHLEWGRLHAVLSVGGRGYRVGALQRVGVGGETARLYGEANVVARAEAEALSVLRHARRAKLHTQFREDHVQRPLIAFGKGKVRTMVGGAAGRAVVVHVAARFDLDGAVGIGEDVK